MGDRAGPRRYALRMTAAPPPPNTTDPALLARFADGLGQFAVNLTAAAVVLVVTLWASGFLAGMVHRALERWPRTRDDATLQGFASASVRVLVLALGLVTVLQRLGVQTASILAVLGAASLAVGLALQGTLGNVAAGVMLLLLRPYRVGDWVEVGGKSGLVRRLDLFHTELTDADGLRVIVPNSKAFGEVIINHTANAARRIGLDFQAAYEDDPRRAAEILRATAAADARVMAEPPPWADVTAYGDAAATVTLRAWCAQGVYDDLRSDLLRKGRAAISPAADRPAESGTPAGPPP